MRERSGATESGQDEIADRQRSEAGGWRLAAGFQPVEQAEHIARFDVAAEGGQSRIAEALPQAGEGLALSHRPLIAPRKVMRPWLAGGVGEHESAHLRAGDHARASWACGEQLPQQPFGGSGYGFGGNLEMTGG